ncbi:uncharacterized protein VTP21DRAFT_5112 [Calcarisporiella thermophila]|uniref:uncharacterized protein n=1 Tax=Calcarisporiella thermophila TaxID=911321 RepID=UPI0037428697
MPFYEQLKSFFLFSPLPSPSPTTLSQTLSTTPFNSKDIAILHESNSTRDRYPGLEQYKGAFSLVYKAIDVETGRWWAIKIVRKFELNVSQRESVLKEVQIMRGLHHPSIVELHDFLETSDFYYLILELLEGGELFNRIVELTYFSEELARHVIIQVAEGIKYLHGEKGIAHRDIKPENLLFKPIPIVPSKLPRSPLLPDEKKEDEGEFIPGIGGGGIGSVKIADFGLSKILWEGSTSTPCGTIGYTAPEIINDKDYSKSVDMWALGCVLYTLLCGFPPFYGDEEECDAQSLLDRVARGEYEFLSPWWDNVSDAAKDLVSRLLCVDPNKRYNIDEFFEHCWIRGEPFSEKPKIKKNISKRITEASCNLYTSKEMTLPNERSPGIAAMKEFFDITYEFQRREDESQSRSVIKNSSLCPNLHEEVLKAGDTQKIHKKGDPFDVQLGDNLNKLNLDELHSVVPQTLQAPYRLACGSENGVKSMLFELCMDRATLLTKRQQRKGDSRMSNK